MTNYICFLPLFIYVRFYQFFKNVIFNLDVYVRLLSPTTNNLFYINRIIFLFLIGFIIINLYWLVLIFKNTSKKIKGLINPNKKNKTENVAISEQTEKPVPSENVVISEQTDKPVTSENVTSENVVISEQTEKPVTSENVVISEQTDKM